jgi:acetyl-CoA acetyltransferase
MKKILLTVVVMCFCVAGLYAAKDKYKLKLKDLTEISRVTATGITTIVLTDTSQVEINDWITKLELVMGFGSYGFYELKKAKSTNNYNVHFMALTLKAVKK